ncbi:MAG: LysR family transcriptional regulator [Verrucomicrobiales bacterium]|nr:LysR family transcriptional regulator [Verrucomicrobiales bacterium]
MLNIHHLELFYYVARHGGIAQAVRRMPYGIQQPAISAQILALEDHLGQTLFRRRPFELTAAGRELFEFAEPFFGRLEEVESRLLGGPTQRLRFGASQVVLRDHLPGILRELRRRVPKVALVLKAGYQQELEQMLVAGEIDLAVTVIDRTVAAGLKSEILIELPLVLWVPHATTARNVEEILGADRISQPLVALRSEEAVVRLFNQELARRGVVWPIAIEAGTLDLVATYAAEGLGVGLGVEAPGSLEMTGVRSLRLDGFPTLPVGLLWGRRLSPVAQQLAELLRDAARVLSKTPEATPAAAPARRPTPSARKGRDPTAPS